MVFRNEAEHLPYVLPSLVPLVDEIVALDDGSDDAGPDILSAAGAKVLTAARGLGEGERRQRLLDEARKRSATHLVIVDADEVFTHSFTSNGRRLIERLAPGESLALHFRTLWRSEVSYRVGREYDMPLRCIVRDDGTGSYGHTSIHEPRLPSNSRRAQLVNPELGEMVHLQFVSWRVAQVKQAWYRCKEVIDGSSPLRVNARYWSTLDSRWVRTRRLGAGALCHVPSLAHLASLPAGWQLDEVLAWFDDYGPSRFEKLQIWDVPELRSAFIDRMGRAPRPSSLTPPAARLAGDAYGALRARWRTGAERHRRGSQGEA